MTTTDGRERHDIAVRISGLTKIYGSTRALDGVDLTVAVGESRALLGRNGAGKSTLIGLLSGLGRADGGTISVLGADGAMEGAGSDAIGCVYQKSTLIPGLTAAENIWLGRYPTDRLGGVAWGRLMADARSLLDEWGIGRVADRVADQLEPVERKIVEICRALSQGPKVLLLDEPTAGLDEGGSQELFAKIAEARRRGVTVIYVSHHLEEVFEVCDSVTILRDGTDVLHAPVSEMTIDSIVDAMVGPALTDSLAADPAARRRAELGETVLAVEGVSVDGAVDGSDLVLRRGECLGLTGLDGAGHVQLAEAIAGLTVPTAGVITLEGRRISTSSIGANIRAGIGYVPEDRHESGFIPALSVEENATMTIFDRIRNRAGLISGSRRRQYYDRLQAAWSIKAAGPTQPIEELSGGNQQKVVLARALASDPAVLVLINPTAGVDVSAKASIYESIAELTAAGRSVIVVSSDDADLAVCDRVLVMFKGRVHAQLPAGWDERELVAAVQGEAA
ncbi:sugar ABC transporter ATP-binding protein [Herbiconiux sp. A18JL235]|uniref:Sugar ABC transporter ATP-binding protein n=1 Tax=Herbiconiux sp. A18JL235 TaxID=3152363 RepID=A0AB39BHR3_9MICO